MADTVGADIKKVLDGMSMRPVPEYFCLGCRLGVFAGGDMIDDRFDFASIKNPVLAPCHKVIYCYRSCYFMAHDDVNLQYFRSTKRLIDEMCCKYFFCGSFTHKFVSLSYGL